MTVGRQVEADDILSPPSRMLGWLRKHPRIVDGAVVVAATAPYVAALWFRADEVGWWGWLAIAVAGFALCFRRRRPFSVLIIVVVACVVSPLAQSGFPFPMMPFAFALYTVASRQSIVRAIVGYGIAVMATLLMTLPYSLSGVAPPLVTFVEPFSVVALASGAIVKSRREQRQQLLANVNERIEHAALAERARIAAEMHDVVAHSLTIIVTLANGATSAWERQPERSKSAVERIGDVGRDALAEMQHTLGVLRDADTGLDEHLHRSGDNLPTLDELIEGFRDAGLPVTLREEGDDLPIGSAVRQAVFRIVQESLTNTLRHAKGAREVLVSIVRVEDEIVVTVSDDGEPTGGSYGAGFGLIGMRERAASLGGEASSAPRAEGGWQTRAVIPVLVSSSEGRGRASA